MGTSLATYYAKLLDMPDSEYKVEILEQYGRRLHSFDHH